VSALFYLDDNVNLMFSTCDLRTLQCTVTRTELVSYRAGLGTLKTCFTSNGLF